MTEKAQTSLNASSARTSEETKPVTAAKEDRQEHDTEHEVMEPVSDIVGAGDPVSAAQEEDAAEMHDEDIDAPELPEEDAGEPTADAAVPTDPMEGPALSQEEGAPDEPEELVDAPADAAVSSGLELDNPED